MSSTSPQYRITVTDLEGNPKYVLLSPRLPDDILIAEFRKEGLLFQLPANVKAVS
jgi:hypothetical protein